MCNKEWDEQWLIFKTHGDFFDSDKEAVIKLNEKLNKYTFTGILFLFNKYLIENWQYFNAILQFIHKINISG